VAVHGHTRRGPSCLNYIHHLTSKAEGEPGVAQGDEHAEAVVADTVHDGEHHEGQQ